MRSALDKSLHALDASIHDPKRSKRVQPPTESQENSQSRPEAELATRVHNRKMADKSAKTTTKGGAKGANGLNGTNGANGRKAPPPPPPRHAAPLREPRPRPETDPVN